MVCKRVMNGIMALLILMGATLSATFTGFGQSQASTAAIEGTVTDETGGILPGATVVVRNIRTGFTRTIPTDDKGYYRAFLLPIGDYEITGEMPGFKTIRVTGIKLTIGQLLTADLKMSLATTTTEVTVTEQTSVVETSRTQLSTTVDDRAVANLPVNGRNFLDFVLLTPGVTGDPRGGDLSFGGLRGTANSVQIDGADNNNTFFGQSLGRTGSGRAPYQFSQDAVQEFQVNNNSYSPEFGRAGGAVINVATRSGTNDFHGTAFEFYRDSSLNANNFFFNQRRPDPVTGRAPRPFYHFNQFGGNFSGPIVRNKLFFFFDYDGQRNNSPTVILPGAGVRFERLPASLQALAGTYNRKFDSDVILYKMDWQVNEAHRLTGRFNHQKFTGVNLENSAQTSVLEHSGNSLVKTDTFTLALNSAFSASLLNEFRFQVARDAEPGTANSDTPEAQILDGSTPILFIGRNNFSPRETTIHKYQVVNNVSVQRGRHNWKFGVDFNWDRILNYFPGFFGGSYRFTSLDAFVARSPASFTQAFAGPGTPGARTHPNSTDIAWFVNDDFRVTPRLTLNLGLRYDVQLLAQPPVFNPNPQLAAAGVRTDFAPRDKNNFGPRFGFAWRPLNTDRLVMRGGYGIFYARTPAITLAQVHSQNGLSVISVQFTGSAMPTYPNRFDSLPSGGTPATPNLYFYHPDFRNAYVQQGSLGMEYGLGHNMSVLGSYLFVKGTHLTRTQDINLFPLQPASIRLAGGGEIPYLRYPNGRPYNNFQRLSQFASNANSVYHGMILQLTRRFSQNYQFLASYTVSKVIDDAPDATSVVAGNFGDDVKIAQYTLLRRLDRSLGYTDQRHRFVLSGVWDLNYAQGVNNPVARKILGGWSLAWILTAGSGRPYSASLASAPGVSSDLNNDGNSANERPPQEGRNIYRGPNYVSFDPRVTWQVPVHERLRLQFIVEAFNLFNRTNFAPSGGTTLFINAAKYRIAPVTDSTGQPVIDPNTGQRVLQLNPLPTFGQQQSAFDARIFQLAVKLVF